MKAPFLQRLVTALHVVRKGALPAAWFNHVPLLDGAGGANIQRPYAESVWVQRAIKTIAEPIASVPLKFRDPATDQEIEDAPWLKFWRAPAHGLSFHEFIVASVGWLKLSGESFWLIDDSWLVPFPEARVNWPRIILARPDRMRAVEMGDDLTGWVFMDRKSRQHTLTAENVLQSKFWNPFDDLRGLSEYESAHVATESDYLAGRFALNISRNNGDTGPYVIGKSGIPDDAQRSMITAQLREKRERSLRGEFRAVFLTGDLSIEDPQIKAPDANFAAQRLQNRHEIYIAFGVPPSFADIVASYSIGSASDFFRLILCTCMPMAEKIAGPISQLATRQAGREVEAYFDWDDHPVMQEVRKERIEAGTKLWERGMPWRDVSDYLDLDLPRFDGDDTGFLPFSVAPMSSMTGADMNAQQDTAFAEPADSAPVEDAPVDEMKAVLRHRLAHPQDAFQRARSAREVALWKSHMAQRREIISGYKSKITRELMKARSQVLAKLEAHKSIRTPHQRSAAADFMFDLGTFQDGFMQAMRKQAAIGLQTAGSQLFDELGKDDPFTMPPPRVMDFLKARENRMADTPQDMYDKIKGVIGNGLESGDSIKDISNAVRSEFNHLSREQATRIAMTETASVYGAGRDEAMRQAGVQYKRWLTSGNANVRPSHANANGQTVPVDESFNVGGEQLMHPGDEHGSPENVINCHCVSIAVESPDDTGGAA